MERYQDKKVVIIGGTSGMGLATAKMLLAERGAEVVMVGRSKAGWIGRERAWKRASPRPRSSIAEYWIFLISRVSGGTTGLGPISVRSFATFCLLTNSQGASRERRLPRTVLVPDPRLHAWVTTCGVYLQRSRGC